jgi:toxoflavin biosynthesis protein ToxD
MRLDEVALSPHFRERAELARRADVHPADLAGVDPQALARLVENPLAALPSRLAAGGILALVGDPRLRPVPSMRVVNGGDVRIGLSESEVDAATARWAHVGVEREWISKEAPEHVVRLADYWIGTYPVTNGEYRDFLDATGHPERPSTWYLGAYPFDRSNHPVAGVKPADAQAYAAWLTVHTGHPWRLPSEAEWEHAARGDDDREFPWGDEFDPAKANTRETGVHTTSPVGAFPAGVSPTGAYDMAGNVEEYVADDYAPYPAGTRVDDHLVATVGTYRVARGGSFARFGDLARTRRRHGAFPSPLYPIGFRLATSVRPPG